MQEHQQPARLFNQPYNGSELTHIAFPMGGLGAGMICLEGNGALSSFSLRNRPDLSNKPLVFSALSIRNPEASAFVVEGPIFRKDAGWGICAGLNRFRQASFEGRFPFGEVSLADQRAPLSVQITGWSPFEPNDADNASLPVAGVEYRFTNHSRDRVEAVFSFNAANFIAPQQRLFSGVETTSRIGPTQGGFILHSGRMADNPWDEGAFAAWVDDPSVKVNHAWFRGTSLGSDALTQVWHDIVDGACYERPPITSGPAAPGASLFLPFALEPGEEKVVSLRLAWYVGDSDLRLPGMIFQDGHPAFLKEGHAQGKETYKPWYAGRFSDIEAVISYWNENYPLLRERSATFSRCLFGSTLPPEVIEAVAANLSILKSPTILRQTDGRLWSWEGCGESEGCWEGSCTHVWNYAQAIPHLFPSLERALRETEFGPSQNGEGHQAFRTALPIRPARHDFPASADGQLGGILKVYRDWRISGDSEWLRNLWPHVRRSLDHCIATWDPRHRGWLEEPQHTTYDVEFWGPNSMCSSIYIAALRAAVLMGDALQAEVALYRQLLEQGIPKLEAELFNGEYFHQKIEWKNLQADPEIHPTLLGPYCSPESLALLRAEGPRYQYGNGCLSDGIIGAWFSLICGTGPLFSAEKVLSHLKSVHKYNLKRDLSVEANLFSNYYAYGSEGGLLLCTWPGGRELSLPFFYSSQVWTGVEYQAASHMIFMGLVDEGLEIVRHCRNRYDGRRRNPFAEAEAGQWYARAMASYALLQAFSGARYDAVERTLYLEPAVKGDFACFLSTATGYGTVGVRQAEPFLKVASGTIAVETIHYVARAC